MSKESHAFQRADRYGLFGGPILLGVSSLCSASRSIAGALLALGLSLELSLALSFADASCAADHSLNDIQKILTLL
jgi:hypothetical protein